MDEQRFGALMAALMAGSRPRVPAKRPGLRFGLAKRRQMERGGWDYLAVPIDNSRYPGPVLRRIRANSVNERGEERRECRRRRERMEAAHG